MYNKQPEILSISSLRYIEMQKNTKMLYIYFRHTFHYEIYVAAMNLWFSLYDDMTTLRTMLSWEIKERAIL